MNPVQKLTVQSLLNLQDFHLCTEKSRHWSVSSINAEKKNKQPKEEEP